MVVCAPPVWPRLFVRPDCAFFSAHRALVSLALPTPTHLFCPRFVCHFFVLRFCVLHSWSPQPTEQHTLSRPAALPGKRRRAPLATTSRSGEAVRFLLRQSSMTRICASASAVVRTGRLAAVSATVRASKMPCKPSRAPRMLSVPDQAHMTRSDSPATRLV